MRAGPIAPKEDNNQIITQYRDGQIALTEALRMLSGQPPMDHLPAERWLSKDQLTNILTELDGLVGLHQVKSMVREIFALLYMQQCREEYHLRTEPVVLHMVFKGNPGTGKTTVARLLAKMFHECGLLSKGHLLEVERADLVGEYIGHTAQKTREVIKKAQGGVLFIDEAYSLARGGEKDFGREAIDCLVKGMEDYRTDFIAIIAGYDREMDWFLSTNPGLPSRFPIHMSFPDYEAVALLEIAKRSAASRQYRLAPESVYKLRRHVEAVLVKEKNGHFSNARYIRNLIEQAIRLHAVRLFDNTKLTRDEVMLLQVQDFRWEGNQI